MEGSGTLTPQITIVVGAAEASTSIASCLESVRNSCRSLAAEIIVVEAGSDPVVRASVADVNCAHAVMPDETLTPVLWGKGIALAQSDCVALLTSHCIVAPEWATALLKDLSAGSDAVGGPIVLGQSASILDSAIYFLRYSAFIEQPEPGLIAGDNSAYRKSALPSTWNAAYGFWELAINRQILSRSGRISWQKDAVVQFQKSFRFSTITRQRFQHGREFGRERVRDLGESRSRIIFASPLVPFVLFARAAGRVSRARRYRLRFLLAAPLFLLIAAFWAAGEAVGAAGAAG